MKQFALNFDDKLVGFDQRFFKSFPTTRYQGSKRKLLPFLYEIFKGLTGHQILDLYSGTASVSLLLRMMGFDVTANDYMLYNRTTAEFLLAVDDSFLAEIDLEKDLSVLFSETNGTKEDVSRNYSGIFFIDAENRQIDRFCENIEKFYGLKKSMYIYLMGQAMLMKRPYNLFHRANLDMRTRAVHRTFGNAKTWETAFKTHIKRLFQELRFFHFFGPKGTAIQKNSLWIKELSLEPDIIYLDPPYLNRRGVGVNYSDFYHFLDGLVDYTLYSRGNVNAPHRPITGYETAWRNSLGGLNEIGRVITRWPRATVVLSYRGDGKPSIDEVKEIFNINNYRLEEHFAVDYKYVLSKADDSTEEILVARPANFAQKM